ncbi:hypothetical protein NA57DRAFT_17562, partial [Rhizodiscina lignyota]
IPVVICIIGCIYLHRRYLQRQKREDNDSRHKSLDFGLEVARKFSKRGKKGQQKIPEMSVTDFEKSVRHGRGLSMDADITSPYILPAALKGSRESIHSLSRSMNDEYDPYRPVTMVSGDNSSIRHPRGRGGDNESTMTDSSRGTDAFTAGLLKNAKGMSASPPPRGDSMSPNRNESMSPSLSAATFSKEVEIPSNPPPPPEPPANAYLKNTVYQKEALSPPTTEPERDSYFEKNAQTFLSDDTYVPPPRSASSRAPALNQSPPKSQPSLPQIDVQEHDFSNTDWHQGQDQSRALPPRGQSLQDSQTPQQEPVPRPRNLGVDQPDNSNHRLSISVRPLPPEDPSEDAEMRANRIRSFYREYFDDSGKHPVEEMPQNPYAQQDYYEDYGQEFLNDGAVFDPETGQFVVASKPFSEPVTRRAMTPPPRAPPRFKGGARGHNSGGSLHSTGTFATPPRGHSAMSNRGFQPKPKRPLAPLQPLKSLPTPHLLKDDTNLIFSAADFAPPVSYRDRQAGRRPDSPLGTARPYSPSVKAFTPLTTSLDDLTVMPSPHLLRKSGTFTALDFAPPTKFRDIDSGSDVASMRSGRSGLSQAQVYNIRAGAYRVSRIPKELAGTKDELSTSLKP